MNQDKSQEEIAKLQDHVQALLDSYVKEQRVDFALKVSQEYLQQEEWLYLIVVPAKEGIRAYEYAKALTDVEEKLRREEHVDNVLLVPSLAA